MGLEANDARAMLKWLVEAGADEALADEPINRFAVAAEPAPAIRPPRPSQRFASAPARRQELAAARACRRSRRHRLQRRVRANLPRGCQTLDELARRARRVRRLRVESDGEVDRVRGRCAGCTRDADRGSAGARRRSGRLAVRRTQRTIARSHVEFDRARPAHERLHHECHLLAAAGQPSADARRGRVVRTLSATSYRVETTQGFGAARRHAG